MRTFKKASLLLVLLAFSAISFNCSSDSSSSSSSNFYLKCKVNGTWVEFTDPFVINSLAKSITGNDSESGKVVTLFTPLNVATGTFTITDEPSNVDSFAGSYSDFNGDVYTDNETGTMSITEVNADVIKGTFTFTGDDGNGGTITVTEGSFRAENIE
jgi:hypothetical protein